MPNIEENIFAFHPDATYKEYSRLMSDLPALFWVKRFTERFAKSWGGYSESVSFEICDKNGSGISKNKWIMFPKIKDGNNYWVIRIEDPLHEIRNIKLPTTSGNIFWYQFVVEVYNLFHDTISTYADWGNFIKVKGEEYSIHIEN